MLSLKWKIKLIIIYQYIARYIGLSHIWTRLILPLGKGSSCTSVRSVSYRACCKCFLQQFKLRARLMGVASFGRDMQTVCKSSNILILLYFRESRLHPELHCTSTLLPSTGLVFLFRVKTCLAKGFCAVHPWLITELWDLFYIKLPKLKNSDTLHVFPEASQGECVTVFIELKIFAEKVISHM